MAYYKFDIDNTSKTFFPATINTFALKLKALAGQVGNIFGIYDANDVELSGVQADGDFFAPNVISRFGEAGEFDLNAFYDDFTNNAVETTESSVTDEAIAIWDGTDGKNIQNSTHKITGDQLLAPAGTSAAPPYSFAASPNSGIWYGGGRLFLIASGVPIFDIANGRVEIIRIVRGADGTESAPMYSFRTQTNGGLWHNSGANEIGFAHEGTNVWKTQDGPFFNVLRAIKKPITTITTNTTLDSSHFTVLVDASGGDVTVTLPAVASGLIYHIKRIDNTANTVLIDGNGAETIDGGATAELTVQYETIKIQADSTEWWIL